MNAAPTPLLRPATRPLTVALALGLAVLLAVIGSALALNRPAPASVTGMGRVAAPPRGEAPAAPPVAPPVAPPPAPRVAMPHLAAALGLPVNFLVRAEAAVAAAAPPLDLTHAVVLRYGPTPGGWVFQITPEQLREAATTSKGKTTLSRTKLQAYLAPVAEALAAPSADATLTLSKGQAVLTPDQTGLALDFDAAATRIEKAAAAANRVVLLPVKAVPANVTAATLRPIQQHAQALLDGGFVLHYNSDEYKLKPATLNRFLTLTASEDAKTPYTLSLDHDKLLDTLDLVAQQVNTPARDPLYREVDGVVSLVIEARPGRKLDYEATAAAMEAAFNAGTNTADMVVAVREPSVTTADTTNIQTPDLLARATTSFSGSSSARAHNVRFGTTLVDGMLVPPGAIFSMNDALGPLTLDRGFEMGYGITRDNKGNLTTVPSEAGGICQVATTFFQSAYWAGLPVVERRNHSYWIPRYGETATGRRGLDATISPPEQDLRVRNTTGNWLKVHAYSNGELVLFELYGVDPNWTVKVTEPVIKNMTAVDHKAIYEKSDLLPAGQTVMVEHAHAGFTATISRKVYAADGALLDNLTLTSNYAPARNRYLTGTGKAVPKR